MYNIEIRLNTSEDVDLLAQQIAHAIENATGEVTRVSVINNRLDDQRSQITREEIMNNMNKRGNI